MEYNALKRRVEALDDDAQARGGLATAALVELRPSVSSNSTPTSEIVVEVWDVGGRRMTIRVGQGWSEAERGPGRAYIPSPSARFGV